MLDKGSEHSESDNSDYDDFSHGAHTPTPSRSARSSASVSLTASRKPRTATSSAQGLKTSRSSRDDDEEANLQRSGKRSRKNHWERERRERIAEGFDGLREVLHSLGIDANSKLEILEKSRSCLLRLVENFKMQDPSQAPGASPAPHQQSTQQVPVRLTSYPTQRPCALWSPWRPVSPSATRLHLNCPFLPFLSPFACLFPVSLSTPVSCTLCHVSSSDHFYFLAHYLLRFAFPLLLLQSCL